MTDMAGYVGFVIGFVGSAPFAWKYLSSGFEINDPGTGMLYFIGIVVAAGLVVGLAGLLLGAGAGFVWERAHRWRRPAAREIELGGAGAIGSSGGATSSATLAAFDPSTISYGEPGFTVGPFLQLSRRVRPKEYDPMRAAEALERSRNIGAWDGDRMIGAVRVLTDGYFVASVPEILIDPDYRGRGIGRELMNRARAAAPRGVVMVGPSPAAATD
jgi:GNAT superfamily N-acetyltransferase